MCFHVQGKKSGNLFKLSHNISKFEVTIRYPWKQVKALVLQSFLSCFRRPVILDLFAHCGVHICHLSMKTGIYKNVLIIRRFRVVTYNVLADLYCDSDYTREVLHPYCPPYALSIDYRKQLYIKEIIGKSCLHFFFVNLCLSSFYLGELALYFLHTHTFQFMIISLGQLRSVNVFSNFVGKKLFD